MAISLPQPKLLGHIFVSIFFSAIVVAVGIESFIYLRSCYDTYLLSTQLLVRIFKVFAFAYSYMIINLPTLALLILNLSKGGLEESKELRNVTVYENKIHSGYLKETGTQTNFESGISLTRSNFVHSLTPAITGTPNSFTRIDHPTTAHSRWIKDSANANNILPFGIFEVSHVPTKFKDLFGFEDIARSLRADVILPFMHSFDQNANDLDTPRKILLTGDPGTGKSALAEAIVNELWEKIDGEIKFYKVDATTCSGSFVSTGATFCDLFHHALESSPSVLLFENVHALEDDSVSSFLSELNSVPKGRVVVIATSSSRRLSAKLVESPTTFDFAYEIPLPNNRSRIQMIKTMFAKRQCVITHDDLIEAAKRTQTFSGGELERLVEIVVERLPDASGYRQFTSNQQKPIKVVPGNLLRFLLDRLTSTNTTGSNLNSPVYTSPQLLDGFSFTK